MFPLAEITNLGFSYGLASAGAESALLWDVGSGDVIRTFEGHSDWVRAVALSGDGTRALSGSIDRTVKLWDVESDQETQTGKPSTPSILSRGSFTAVRWIKEW